MAVKLYFIAGHSISQKEFKRAAKICLDGQDLPDHVITVVFKLFDEKGILFFRFDEFFSRALCKDFFCMVFPTTLYVLCLRGCISYVSGGRENGLNTGVYTCQKSNKFCGGVFLGGKAEPTDLNLLDLKVSSETQIWGCPKKCPMRHVFLFRSASTST